MNSALDSKSLDCSRSTIRILYVSEFLLIRGLFLLLFVFFLIELLFGRSLARGCEAQLLLCARIKEKLHFSYYKNFEGINYFAFAVLLSIFVPKDYKFEELF